MGVEASNLAYPSSLREHRLFNVYDLYRKSSSAIRLLAIALLTCLHQ